jgi:hypothetical protein
LASRAASEPRLIFIDAVRGNRSGAHTSPWARGDRYGILSDPSGNRWSIATHVEDIAPEEAERRIAELMKQMGHPE